MALSIIIVTFKRVQLLQRCLRSVEQSLNRTTDKIIIVVNGKDLETEQWLNAQGEHYTILKLNDRLPPACARNVALKEAQGDFVVFLDDDVTVPEHYFAEGERILARYPEIDVFGGPDQSDRSADFYEKTLGLALTSPLATASTRSRHMKNSRNHIGAGERKLILCNMWARLSLFCQENFVFDGRFYRNEENVLLFQLKKADKKMAYFSNLFVYHKRKAHLLNLMRAVFNSGRYRMRSFIIYPRSFSPIYLIPALFVLYLAILPFGNEFWQYLPAIMYLFLNLSFAIFLGIRSKSMKSIPLVCLYQLVISLSYGMGLLRELFRVLINR